MLSDEWLPRYRLLENFTAKWNGNGNGNGNAYDRGDYNSSFALRAVELKTNKTANTILKAYGCKAKHLKLSQLQIKAMSRENRSSVFPTRSETNQAVQAQKMARLEISVLESRAIVLFM